MSSEKRFERGLLPSSPEEIQSSEHEKDVEMMDIYKESTIVRKLNRRREEGKTPFVVFSDIDGTFYHPDRVQEMQQLAAGLGDSNMGLVLVTGRRDSHRSLSGLPRPDVLIQAAGSEIYVFNGREFVLDQDYSEEIQLGWNREEIYSSLNSFLENSARWQEKVNVPEQSSKWEIVSWFTGSEEEVMQYVSELEESLLDSHVTVTYWENHRSNSFDFIVGILPMKAGKAEAVQYLQTKLGDIDGLVAGDSRLDADMLTQSKLPAVIVGGATPSLISAVEQSSHPSLFKEIRELREGNWVYIVDQGKEELKGAGGINSALKTGLFLKKDVFEDLAKRL